MGWTYQNARFFKGARIDKKAEMTNIINEEWGGCKVLDCSLKGGVYYAAVERFKDKDKKERQVFGVVCLVSASDSTREFGHKDMDEDCGPFYYDCPSRILDLLTPTENFYAIEWRKKCKENKAKDVAAQLRKLPIGSVIKVDDLHYVKESPNRQFKRPWWRCIEKYCYIPISWIKEFKVIEPQPAKI